MFAHDGHQFFSLYLHCVVAYRTDQTYQPCLLSQLNILMKLTTQPYVS